MSGPIRVEVTRGPRVESVHHVHAAVVDARGDIVTVHGAVDVPVFPRSAIKPIQALPLIETGAADALGLGAEEVALACASHSGQPVHIEVARRWLARLSLRPEALACGGHAPADEAARGALIRSGEPPSRLHDNCSGKHLGLLSTVRHLGESIPGYHLASHPAQRRWMAALEDLSGTRSGEGEIGVDGCGIPTVALPLRALARAAAALAGPERAAPRRRSAIARVVAAMTAHPVLVAGDGRFATEVLLATRGRVVAKNGAEGVFLALLSGRGIGIAVKVEDGAPRAAEAATAVLLDRLGAFAATERRVLAHRLHPTVSTRAGEAVGEIRVRLPQEQPRQRQRDRRDESNQQQHRDLDQQ